MRYFVTGGCGFIGSNYVKLLLESQEDVSKVTVFDNLTYSGNLKNIESIKHDPRFNFVKGNICDKSLLNNSVKNHDYVINFAAESHVDRSIMGADIFVETNLVGTYNVLEACKLNEVMKLVQISTDEVYGSINSGSCDEFSKLSPSSPYSSSKAGADLLALSYFSTFGLDVMITRSCNNYGLYQFPEKIIPFFIFRALKGEKLPIYGNGENIREWIHVSDNCRAIQTVLNEGSAGEIYNIGSGFQLSNLVLASKILSYMGHSNSKIEFVLDRLGHDYRYSLDSSKLKTLGFETEIDFNEGLKETIKWYEVNTSWWN
jgi:dTDP-glucose 4,6-dehydratase